MGEHQNTRASGALPGDDPLFAPGLKRRLRQDGEVFYWIPPGSVIKAGYPIKALTLPAHASELEVAELCRGYWGQLENWRNGLPEGPEKYTIAWLVKRYETDEHSPFHALRPRSKRSYEQFGRYLSKHHGKERIDQGISGATVRKWHMEWSKPNKDGKPTTPSRARHMIVHFRILASYAVELRVPGAVDLRNMLAAMRFKSQGQRNVAPTRSQALAFAAKAIEMGYPSQAKATLAQFLLTERRTHIIGTYEGEQWRPGWVWNDIDWTGDKPSWVIRYWQTKVGRVLREYDLHDTPELLEMLQATPVEKRMGPVIICESERHGSKGLPWRERHYAEVWRKIAKAAGIPDDVCSRDMRAGGATEADGIEGITPADLKAAGGWKNDQTVAIYTRAPQRRAQRVVKRRNEIAAQKGDGK